jgi:hypothetical protein
VCQEAVHHETACFTVQEPHRAVLDGFPAVQSVQKAASELLHYSDASTEEVAAFLTHLGGIGAGLHEMLQTEQNVGGVFGKFKQHSRSIGSDSNLVAA